MRATRSLTALTRSTDWTVFTDCRAGTVLGLSLGRWMKHSADMFTAGSRQPWQESGLIASLTICSPAMLRVPL